MLLKLWSLHLSLWNIGSFQLGSFKHLLITLLDFCDHEKEDKSRPSSCVNRIYRALSDTWKNNGFRKQGFFLTTLKPFLTNLLRKKKRSLSWVSFYSITKQDQVTFIEHTGMFISVERKPVLSQVITQQTACLLSSHNKCCFSRVLLDKATYEEYWLSFLSWAMF